jgi:SAM-dependent methyltransferase
MPTSRFEHISDVAKLIEKLSPSTFLDVGCGFGRWGFLVREVMDINRERYAKHTWLTKIDAVEIFPSYIVDHHRYLYDNIYISSIEAFSETMPSYDLIIIGDVIEHLDKTLGQQIIEKLKAMATKALIVGIPLGDQWEQGTVLGNVYETHKSTWDVPDLRLHGAKLIKVYSVNDRRYALAVWSHHRLPILDGHYMLRSDIKRLPVQMKQMYIPSFLPRFIDQFGIGAKSPRSSKNN